MILPYFAKTTFEVEVEEGQDDVSVYELHLTENFILGLFVWPRGWEWTWGLFPGLFNSNGSVLHAGPVSFGYYRDFL